MIALITYILYLISSGLSGLGGGNLRIQILCDLQSEVDRLFIAGSKFAAGDPRISGLLPTLEKIGEKAPVMKRLADMTGELLRSDQPEAALADLGVFLDAVISTQGETTVKGMAAEPTNAYFTALPQTIEPYSALEPVIAALTSTGPARHEVIKKAHESGRLSDFRLYGLLSRGLGDKYSAISEFLAGTVIPSLGAVMIPFLLGDFDMAGDAADAARLMLLDTLGYEGVVKIAESAVNEGSGAVQVEAIKILGRNPDNEALLLSFAGDRKSQIREAALIGLVRLDSAPGKEKMMEILSSSKFSAAVPAAAACNDPEYNRRIFGCVENCLNEVIEAGKSDDSKLFVMFRNKFFVMLNALAGKDEDYIYDFLGSLFSNEGKGISPSILINLMVNVHTVLSSMSNGEAVLSVYERIAKLTVLRKDPHPAVRPHTEFATHYFLYAQKFHPPHEIYDIFAPYYTDRLLEDVCFWGGAELDARWADILIKAGDIDNIGALINSGARGRILKYLNYYVKKNSGADTYAPAAKLLIENLDAQDLEPVAKDLCKTLVAFLKEGSSQHMNYFYSVYNLILDDGEIAQKLFSSPGARKHAKVLYDFLSGSGTTSPYHERIKTSLVNHLH